MKQKTCIIVGGGISGLITATLLKQAGFIVTVLDKGRRIGGRLATRRVISLSNTEGIFDYGAQFLSVTDPLFKVWIERLKDRGVAVEWTSELGQGNGPCYSGIRGNRSIAEYMAKDLEVHTQAHVIRLFWKSDCWFLQAKNGSEFKADYLVLTAPIPQILSLLDSSMISLQREQRQRLEEVIYQRCIAVLALLERPSTIPNPGAKWLNNTTIAWIACNQRKGISQGNAVTLHSSSEFSQIYWETDNSIVAEKLIEAASPLLGSAVVNSYVHRWRYSQPITTFGESYLALDHPGPLIMAGDAFSLIPSIASTLNAEKAFLSGCAAANYLLRHAR
jgi:renalase